jgi:transposase IS66
MKNDALNRTKLNSLSKDTLILLLLQQLENFQLLSAQSSVIQKQNEQLIKQIESLKEQLAILTNHRFGRKTEVSSQIPGQLSLDFGDQAILNEVELAVAESLPEEPTIEEVVVRKKRTKGKRAANLDSIEVESVCHACTEEELTKQFPKGWHELPDEVYNELLYTPAKFKVLEHHVKVYAGDCDKGGILRAKAPNRLLSHSILTPELAAAVFNAKYVNAMPLNRLSEEFLRNDVNIPRQDMAGWMIRLADYYLEPVHKMMKAELLQSHHVHCDETPFIMPEHSKEYMWVFHSPEGPTSPPVFLYEYLGGRNGTVLEKYLKGYKGTLVTDGYQPYHTLMKKDGELKVAGCWAHARRKFAEIIKATRKGQVLTPAQEAASEAIRMIDMIYHRDNSFKESSTEERLINRQQTVAPLVDAYFAWVKQTRNKICGSQKLTEALNYSFNQEPYLRVFLQDALIPLDNNDAERSIRSFCVGKHSWHIIDSVRGASASALLYSIAESAKANQLKPYEYFAYLLKELLKYPRENVPEEELKKLMPWSEALPDSCRKNKTR